MSSAQSSSASPDIPRPAWRRSPANWILAGLSAGTFCGLFFGESCAGLKVVGDAFVGLLQMTVLPYLVVTLLASIARLAPRQSRRLGLVGGVVLGLLWLSALVAVVVFSRCLPVWKAGSFFSSALTEPPRTVDYLELFIPANVFAAMAQNVVPAVVVFCVVVGVALAGVPRKGLLIRGLQVLAAALTRVNGFILRLTPVGVFAIAASAAGTMSFDEFARLQSYLVVYTAAVLLLTFLILPLLVSTLTPFGYRDVLRVSQEALLTAFATGKLVVVLPSLIAATEQLFARERCAPAEDEAVPAVDVLYPLAYAFPHLGKILSILFVPFAAWFLGNTLRWEEYPRLLAAGVFSQFAGPNVAVPFLLDLMRIPHDMFQLFLLSGVYCGRLSDVLGVMHLVTFAILTTCLFTGRLRVCGWRVLRFVLGTGAVSLLVVVLTRVGLSMSLQYLAPREEVIAEMQLLDEPVAAVVGERAVPNPVPLRPGQTLLQRIRQRGVIRVGFSPDKLPFAFFNIRGELVGYDVNAAHALARDLGVTIEFVPFERETLVAQVRADHFDVVMSGLVGTLERSETLAHTAPYLDVTLALVVPDYRARELGTLEALRRHPGLRVGFVDLSRCFVARLREDLPNAEFVELRTNREYFTSAHRELDALLISAESGSAFTLLYPEFEVVLREGRRVALPLFYVLGARDNELQDFLEHWIDLRRKDGTLQQHYEHWIMGRTRSRKPPRWSILRNVLGWRGSEDLALRPGSCAGYVPRGYSGQGSAASAAR